MKKFFFMGVGVALTCLVFYACDVTKQLEDVNKAGYICSNYTFSKPNEMAKQDVIDMVKNYYDNQYKILHNSGTTRIHLPSTNQFDSRAVFFNLDTLKRLIYYIEKATINLTDAEKQNLGINAYFASYPEKSNKMQFGHNYNNRHTLVFIPSMVDPVNHLPQDIDVLGFLNRKVDNINTPQKILTDFYNSGGSILAMSSRTTIDPTDPTGMSSQNNGTGTPPPPPSGGLINGDTGNPLLDITSQ